MVFRRLGVLALGLLLVAAGTAAAQETRGTIEGVIKDTTGGVLPGVTVTVKHEATGAVTTAVTDTTGAYRIPGLQTGMYTVTATLSGFKPETMDKIDLGAGLQLRVPLIMSVAGLAVAEVVRAETPIVDVRQNAVTSKVTADLIERLPSLNRDFQSVLNGIAGTNYETEISGSRATGVMVDGASQSENRFVIDGQDTTNLRTGLSGKSLAIDFVEQIQVKQSGYNAEFRATTGGVISAITKSGTNMFHGGASINYNGRMLNGLAGDIRPGLRLNPNVSGSNPPAEYFTTPRTSEYERYTIEPVYDIGGPILRNKAFFYFGYNNEIFNQWRTVEWPNPVSGGVTYPSVQTFNAKSTDQRYLYNTTFNLGPNVRMRVNGNNQFTTGALGLPGIDNATFRVDADGNTIATASTTVNVATFNPRSQTHGEGYNHAYSGILDWNLSPKMYANLTVGFMGAGSGNIGDYFHGIRRQFSGSNINYLDVPPDLQHPSGYADNPTNSFTVKDNYSRMAASGDLTRFANWNGQHAFKMGVQYERIGNDVNQGQQFPNVSVVWNASRTTLDNRSVRGTYGYYSVVQQYTVGAIHSNNIGTFLQDQWSFNEKLTINYGVRFDYTNIPSYREENPGITFGWDSKVAPRLGFAYDLKGDGKWKLFGSWGGFFDIEKLEMPRGAWGADRWVTYYWTLDDYNWDKINCDGTIGSGCPGTYIEQNDLRHVSNDPKDNLVDPNMKPFKAQEFVVGVDHELSRLIRVGTRYVHKWVNNAIEDIGVQVVGIGEVFYIANPGYGLGAYPLTTAFPRTPFPVRDYDALEVTFNRRLQNNWSLSANVTFSRLYGNYSGLSNSTSESNRNSPNVTRLWDGLFMSFTEEGCPDYVNCEAGLIDGLISTDRPIQFKLQGTYMLPWGTAAGVTFSAFNGNLQTSSVSYKSVPVMLYGQSDLGRTPLYNNTDLNFSQSFDIPKSRFRVTAQFVIVNVFDQDFPTAIFTSPWRDSLVLPNDGGTLNAGPFFAGFDAAAVQAARFAASNGTLGRPDPRYGLDSSYRGARSARFYVRLQF